jgi:hypothetical protein
VIAAYLAGALKPIDEREEDDPYKLSAEERSLLKLLSSQAGIPSSGARKKRKSRAA